MCLGPHAEDAVEVVDVDVNKDSEESGQNLGADLLEVLGEGNSWGWRGMEEGVKILRANSIPSHRYSSPLLSTGPIEEGRARAWFSPILFLFVGIGPRNSFTSLSSSPSPYLSFLNEAQIKKCLLSLCCNTDRRPHVPLPEAGLFKLVTGQSASDHSENYGLTCLQKPVHPQRYAHHPLLDSPLWRLWASF